MANMRAKGKKLRTLWLDEVETEVLVLLAKKADLNISDFLKRPVTDYIKLHHLKK